MSKTWIAVGAAFLVGIGVTVGVVKFLSKTLPTTSSPISPIAPASGTASDAVNADTRYESQSGFSFQYPQDLTITDETPSSGSYYSLLTIKRGSEQLKFSIKDTTATSIDSWIAKDSEAPKNPILVGPAKIGDLDAKQYSASGKLYSIAVSDSVAYWIIGIKDGGYWEKVHQRLLSTLMFAAPTPRSNAGSAASQTSGSGASDDSNTVYEPEEVVQ